MPYQKAAKECTATKKQIFGAHAETARQICRNELAERGAVFHLVYGLGDLLAGYL